MPFLKEAARWTSTVGGVGYCPVVPATFGSAVGVLLYQLGPADLGARLALAGAQLGLGFWSAGYSQELFRSKDARQIVIDETSSMYLMLMLAGSRTWAAAAAAFVLFRILDVLKPLGIRRLEALPGGVGIMADDIAAGLLGAAVMRGVLALTPNL
ncbi:MAG: phosphatidylglycerophosphatase A [Elusimicrobia bacterium]|nr:phosphatidylglycerophosphatase A [Elusimicrobiota bacterium]